MKSTARSGCGVILFLAVACGAPELDSSGEVTQAIHGGEVVAAEGDPAVGLLEFASGNFGTGTLISPRVVLTAGHVAGGNIQGFFLGRGKPIRRGVDTSASDTMRKVPIAEKIIHPSYECKTDCEQWKGWDLDMAIIVLAEPVTDVAPVRFGLLEPSKEAVCRTVGFGDFVADWDAADAAPTVKEKRSASSTISRVRPYVFETTWLDGVADSGDSGGPILCEREGISNLVGTVAYHTDGEGAQHVREWYARVDVAMPWLEERLRALGETWPPSQNLDPEPPVEEPDAAIVESTPDASSSEPEPEPEATKGTSDEAGGCSLSRSPEPSPSAFSWGILLLAVCCVRRRRGRITT